jgi:hypothetical protein
VVKGHVEQTIQFEFVQVGRELVQTFVERGVRMKGKRKQRGREMVKVVIEIFPQGEVSEGRWEEINRSVPKGVGQVKWGERRRKMVNRTIKICPKHEGKQRGGEVVHLCVEIYAELEMSQGRGEVVDKVVEEVAKMEVNDWRGEVVDTLVEVSTIIKRSC